MFRCVKGVCFLLGTIRGQVGELTMAPQDWTVLWELGSKAPGKGWGMLGGAHCCCWMIGIMGVKDADCFLFF